MINPGKIDFNEGEVTCRLSRKNERKDGVAQYMVLMMRDPAIWEFLSDRLKLINILTEQESIPNVLNQVCPEGYEITEFTIRKYVFDIAMVTVVIEPEGYRYSENE